MNFKYPKNPSCFCLCCVLSPDILDSIKRNGNTQEREYAESIEEQNLRFLESRREATPPGFSIAPSVSAVIAGGPKRKVYDSSNTQSLQNILVRSEGDPATGDVQADEAYEGAGATYKLYLDIYERDSLDGRGMELISNVHFGTDYENAFWDGRQMAYGDGGRFFKSLTGDLSIIAHEFSHGVVQFSGGLEYQDQAGALNEHFSDVFGSLAKQYALNQKASEADWLIGKDLLQPSVSGVALRSMKAPGTAYADDIIGTDPQPYHMDYYVATSRDNGGVHINSGIPNHAFYILSMMLGGFAWDKAGRIWYKTMQDISNPFATFTDWADLTVKNAQILYGIGSTEARLVRRAWKLVGVEL